MAWVGAQGLEWARWDDTGQKPSLMNTEPFTYVVLYHPSSHCLSLLRTPPPQKRDPRACAGCCFTPGQGDIKADPAGEMNFGI